MQGSQHSFNREFLPYLERRWEKHWENDEDKCCENTGDTHSPIFLKKKIMMADRPYSRTFDSNSPDSDSKSLDVLCIDSNFHSPKDVLALLQGGRGTYGLHLYLIGSSAKDYMTAS